MTTRNNVFGELGLPNIANTEIYFKNIYCSAPFPNELKMFTRKREDLAKEDDTRAEITRATKVNTSGQT